MRLEWSRALVAGTIALALAGCVTTTPSGGDGSVSPARLPRASRAEQAESAARVHTELGQRYLQNGDLKAALDKLTKALQFDDRYAPAHTVIAVIYERIGDMPNAELHYRRAEELEPKAGAANNNLAAFLCKIGKNADAQGYFKKAVADPFYQTPEVALTNAGVCAAGAGDLVAAEQSLRQALKLNPNSGEALYQLANVLYKRGDAFRARAFIQRYDALGQATPAALKLGHDIEFRLGNMDAALDYARRLSSQFPDSEQARAIDAPATP